MNIEKLTAATGVDFVSEDSFHRQYLLSLPDPKGVGTRLSLWVSQLVDEVSQNEFYELIQLYFSKEIFSQLALLFPNSPILSRYLSKNSKAFQNLFPLKKSTEGEFRSEQQKILQDLFQRKERENEEDIFHALIRQEKARQFMAIALADYLGWDSFEETVAKITLFAEMAIAYALRYSKLETLPVCVIGSIME